jgi:hypothetical protein
MSIMVQDAIFAGSGADVLAALVLAGRSVEALSSQSSNNPTACSARANGGDNAQMYAKQHWRRVFGLALLLVFVPVLLSSCSSRSISNGQPEQLVGRWKSTYWQSQVVLDLKADGSFVGEVLGFPSLPDRTFSGTWFVDEDAIVFDQFLIIESEPPSGDQPETYYYTVADTKVFDIKKPLFGSVYFENIEPFHFSRAD